MFIKTNLTPFVKWAGSKNRIIPQLNEHFPKTFNNYYEPFLGSGSVLFYLQPQTAIVNDLNEELINTYEVIRDFPKELIESCENHIHKSEYYYWIRNLDRNIEKFYQLSNIDRASRFIYLNKTCFNGLYRVNKKNQFNVPIGTYKKPTYLIAENIYKISTYLNENNVNFSSVDYKEVLKDCKENDFIYLDPPYYPKNKSFTSYTYNSFQEPEHIKLKITIDELTKKHCKVLLSNSSCYFIEKLYESSMYKKNIVFRSGNINSNKDKRGLVEELLIKNYED